VKGRKEHFSLYPKEQGDERGVSAANQVQSRRGGKRDRPQSKEEVLRPKTKTPGPICVIIESKRRCKLIFRGHEWVVLKGGGKRKVFLKRRENPHTTQQARQDLWGRGGRGVQGIRDGYSCKEKNQCFRKYSSLALGDEGEGSNSNEDAGSL